MDPYTAAQLLGYLDRHLVECDNSWSHTQAFFESTQTAGAAAALTWFESMDVWCDCEAMLYLASEIEPT